MTMDFAVPLITGLFVGGIVTEVRWVLRLRQLQGEIAPNRSMEPQEATAFVPAETQAAGDAQFSLGLQSLQEHLAAEGGTTPATEPVRVGTREA